MFTKKTKIVATIGPVTANEEMLTNMIKAGLNVLRINFSHGDFAEHAPKVTIGRAVAKKLGKPVAILQDLGGPKIRIGEFDTTTVVLKPGAKFILTTEKIIGNVDRVHVNYPLLPKEVKVGGFILLDDGKKKLQITNIKGKEVVCKVLVGGETKGRRGVNLPGAYLSISSITDKDRVDLEFGIKHKVDYIALSFVRRPEDIKELRSILNKRKCDAKIIAKIETPEALENIDEIIHLADGVMVARGDLAIEIPAEDVPVAQKMLIRKCHEAGKPVITATQMLESMIKSPVPTRAEVSDVANAIFDGTDAIMLSEETTLGDYPLEAVTMMSTIAKRIEKELVSSRFDNIIQHGVADIVSDAVVEAAYHADAKFIVALTNSGFTARMIARHRPNQHILAMSPNTKALNQLCVAYGVTPVSIEKFSSLADVMKFVRVFAIKNKLASKNDKVILVGGWPFGKSIDTNMMVIETI